MYLTENGKFIKLKSAWLTENGKFVKLKSAWLTENGKFVKLFFGGGLIARRLVAATWYSTYYSDDKGETWTQKSVSQGTNIYSAATNGETMVISSNRVEKAVIRYTKDGETWTQVNEVGNGTGIGLANFLSYSLDLKKFFCVKQQSGGSSLWSSEDGVTWSWESTGGLNYSYITRCPIIYDAVNDLFLIVNNIDQYDKSSVLYRIPTENYWREGTSRTIYDYAGMTGIACVATHDGLSVSFCGSSNDIYPLYSFNGKSWTKGAKSTFASVECAIVYGNDRFVRVPQNNSSSDAGYSFDGKTWTKATGISSIFSNAKSLIYDGTQFIATSTDGTMYRSADGTAWETMTQKLDTYGAISFLT